MNKTGKIEESNSASKGEKFFAPNESQAFTLKPLNSLKKLEIRN